MPLHPRRESGSLLHEPYNAKKMAATEMDIVLVLLTFKNIIDVDSKKKEYH